MSIGFGSKSISMSHIFHIFCFRSKAVAHVLAIWKLRGKVDPKLPSPVQRTILIRSSSKTMIHHQWVAHINPGSIRLKIVDAENVPKVLQNNSWETPKVQSQCVNEVHRQLWKYRWVLSFDHFEAKWLALELIYIK